MKFLSLIAIALLLTACGGGSGDGNTTPTLPSNMSPTANFTAACTDKNCTFTNSSSDSDGTIASVAWDFGDGNTSAETNSSHTFADYGDYTVSLTVTDNDSATVTTSQTVTVTVDVHSQVATIDWQDASIIFAQDFNHRPDTDTYTLDELHEDFECNMGISGQEKCQQQGFAVDEFAIQGGEIKVTFTEGMIGSGIGLLKFLDDQVELFLTFKVRFDQNYDVNASGGKLMGMGGAPDGYGPPTGCVDVGDDDGFSTRFTYGRNHTFYNYIYHQDKTQVCGDNRLVYEPGTSTHVAFNKDQTYLLEMHVKMNDVGQANGLYETRINGMNVNSLEEFEFSESGGFGINTMLFQLYLGGADDSAKLSEPGTLYLDDYIISTRSVVIPQ